MTKKIRRQILTINHQLLTILLLFSAWRIWLFLFAAIGAVFVAIGSSNFLGGRYVNYSSSPLLWGWGNFDGEHYLSIARYGYRDFQYFFFPLYPALVGKLSSLLSFVENRFLISGLLVSNVAFLFAIFVFLKLVLIDYKKEVAIFSILALAFFPTSFFFASLYSESLFLLLVLLSFYFARRGRFLLAGGFAALASATRLVGVLLLPALVIEWYSQREEGKKLSFKTGFLGILIAPLGLLRYMLYLKERTGDPLIFYTQISHFGQQRAEEITLLYQVFWRYAKMLMTVARDTPIYFTISMEFIVAILALGLLVWGLVKKVRASYLTFAFLGYILPTFSGSFSSLPRYVLPLFPLFIVLGLLLSERGKLTRVLYFLVSAAFLAVETILFVRGYWVG